LSVIVVIITLLLFCYFASAPVSTICFR